jgi:hypothetical protein
MASKQDRVNVQRDDEFRTADEGGDTRGPYGGAGDYGASYTAGGFSGAGFGGGYSGYDRASLYGGYAGGYGRAFGYGRDARDLYRGDPRYGRERTTGVSAGPAFPAANRVEYGSADDIPVPVPQFEPRRNFAGRGPRGYRRSDARIRDEICEILTRHPEIDATDIDITVENGVVTLGGTVEDRYTKRLAADVAELTLGVHEVDNRLRIA